MNCRNLLAVSFLVLLCGCAGKALPPVAFAPPAERIDYLADLPDFLAMLRDFDGCPAALARLDRYGVNRARPDFWEVYDRFQQAFDAVNPVQAGLFDLNRYFYLARTQE